MVKILIQQNKKKKKNYKENFFSLKINTLAI